MASRTVKAATTSALLALSDEKLKAVAPELYSARSWNKFLRENGYRLGAPNETIEYWKNYIAEYLRCGDPRAAIVVSAAPLLVAAYAGELDCVAMLRFDKKLARLYGLGAGSRLLTINTYLEWNFWLPEDLKLGPRDSGKYRNFAPLVAEFLSGDEAAIQQLKAAIDADEWNLAESLGREYLNQFGEKARDGRPLLCHLPAKK
ncbi:MAG: hypothetical protein ACREEM_01835 [Blastocatellia bacterium]